MLGGGRVIVSWRLLELVELLGSGHMLSWSTPGAHLPPNGRGRDNRKDGPPPTLNGTATCMMLPPVDNTVLRNNPEFAVLYSKLTNSVLNPDASTKNGPATKERRAVTEVGWSRNYRGGWYQIDCLGRS